MKLYIDQPFLQIALGQIVSGLAAYRLRCFILYFYTGYWHVRRENNRIWL